MSQFKVLLTDRPWSNWEIEARILAGADAEIIAAPDGDEGTLVELARDCDAIGTCWAQVTDKVIDAVPDCRGVARFGIGLDNIAVDTATRQGIPVTYIPDYCVAEVADHALALLLACARNVAFFYARTKAGEYDLRAAPAMQRLSGCVLGLVGLGRIGAEVAKRARAFGLETIAHTPSGDPRDSGCQLVSFEELLERSDFVSLHCPLTAESRGMFALPQFERMKRSAYLINTSRGGVIVTNDLWTALQRKEIAGAALDVFDPEPPDLSQPLYRDERVIVTPHAAFVSQQSLAELRQRVARQIADMLHGRRPEHLVNPQIWRDRN